MTPLLMEFCWTDFSTLQRSHRGPGVEDLPPRVYLAGIVCFQAEVWGSRLESDGKSMEFGPSSRLAST